MKATTHKSLANLLVFSFEEGYERYVKQKGGSDMSHEAGYDAYMTGVVFLTMMKYTEVGKFLRMMKET